MQIEYDGGTVTGIEYGDPGPIGILLAHGAGAGRLREEQRRITRHADSENARDRSAEQLHAARCAVI